MPLININAKDIIEEEKLKPILDDAITQLVVGLNQLLTNREINIKITIGDKPKLRRTEIERLTRGIEHDEIVARAMHLGEMQFHAGDDTRPPGRGRGLGGDQPRASPQRIWQRSSPW